MIRKLKNISDSLKFQFNRLFASLDSEQLYIYDIINSYLVTYCCYNNIMAEEALARYMSFVERYENDLKKFDLTGKFPFQLKEKQAFSVDRITYDLFLIITSLVTPHRFAIMEYIYNTKFKADKCLIVGVGSGLEIELINKKFREIDAYDLSISDFVKDRFKHVSLKEEYYQYSEGNKYNAIFAIEILEHMFSPYSLIKEFKESLVDKGRLIVTTTKNVPQFDHYYNFTEQEKFENEVKSLGFKIIDKQTVKHNYLFIRVDANNTIYNLEMKDKF